MGTEIMTSVVIAACVAALVSGLFTLFDRRLDRQSRLDELLLSKAVELTKMEMDRDLIIARARSAVGKPSLIAPPLSKLELHHKELKNLIKTGRVSDDYTAKIERQKSDLLEPRRNDNI